MTLFRYAGAHLDACMSMSSGAVCATILLVTPIEHVYATLQAHAGVTWSEEGFVRFRAECREHHEDTMRDVRVHLFNVGISYHPTLALANSTAERCKEVQPGPIVRCRV